ncbi:TonB-dependent receptor plug domain-containing protein [Shewanella indica]|uniref:TonB-dependent receptor plug domain-containing protein n=1 Tax=Shewanella indica TaxID=768528 RepID=UPI0030057A91
MKKHAAVVCGLALMPVAQAQQVDVADQQEIIVREQADNGLTQHETLTREDIKKRPTGDGNLTDLLRSNPAVQFSNSANSSLNQGEIKPADISIHGSNAYQNAFLLDGMSINNDLDPVDGSVVTNARLSSDEQGLYVDSRLIDSVTLYDANIPVEFGGFTGGVVDATTRSWQGETAASVYFRQTDASWNKVHIDDKLQFDSANNDLSQPARFQTDYSKRNYGLSFETGITDDLGFVASVSRRESKIPMMNVPATAVGLDANGELVAFKTGGGLKHQRRTSDNLFSKFTWYASPRTTAHLSLAYSAYEADMFFNGVANSDYRDEHKGYSSTLEIEHGFDASTLELSLNYNRMTDKRAGEQTYWVQLMDWQSNRSYSSGGPGDLDSTQETSTAKLKWKWDPLKWAGMSHTFTLGGEASYTDAAFNRDKTYYRNNYDGSLEMMGWSQLRLDAFLEGRYKSTHSQYALYVEDVINWGDFSFRPGLRLDHDGFVNRNNLAPRLSSSWNLFGDGNTLLTAGANRYYGRSMLTYALYSGQNGGLVHCYFDCKPNSADNDWMPTRDYEGMEDLQTPYNDEFTAGVQQIWGNSIWKLNYVHRNGRDEVRSRYKYPGTDDYEQRAIRTFDNSGSTSHDSVIFTLMNRETLQFLGANHQAKFSVAWQETKSNTPKDQGYSYFESGLNVDADKVWYDGKVIAAADLPATDFNAPWKIDLELTHEFDDYGLTWYNLLHWTSSREQASRDQNGYFRDPETGKDLVKYSKVDFASTFRWDTKLQWQPEFAKGASVSVEIYNLLNRKNANDSFVHQDQLYFNYEPGRQFWLQLNYEY